MSAIAGIYYFAGSADIEPELNTLVTAMSHRGPDGSACWIRGSTGFGHCRLNATPESLHEILPFEDASARLTITADVRLDNREDLIRQLELNNADPASLGDSQLILAAYKKWGKHCASRLLGDFAFAIWDAHQQQLYCARDHLGAKYLAYVRKETRFAFATESEALSRLADVSTRPNEDYIATWFYPEVYDWDSRKTLFDDIAFLGAGEYLCVTANGKLSIDKYWRLSAVQQDSYGSELEALEAFQQVFSEVVRCRLRTTCDPAMMMSGGMDSASLGITIKALISEIPGKRLHTYSTVADDVESCIESQCIQSLVEATAASSHVVSVPSFSGMITREDMFEAAWKKAHPVDNSILLPAMMCLAAQRNNHRVLLHGVTGDLTTTSSVHYIADYLRQGHFVKALRESHLASRNHTYLLHLGALNILARNIWSAWAGKGMKRALKMVRGRETALFGNNVLADGFLTRMRIVERIRAQRVKSIEPAKSAEDEALAYQITSGLNAFGRIAGHHGIELRDPWADIRVVEFFLRLPMEYRVNNGWTKYIVRRAFASGAGDRVCWRRDKEHLGYHFARTLMQDTHAFVCSELQGDLGILAPYLNMDALADRFERYKADNKFADLQFFFNIMTLKLWLEKLS